MRRIPCACVDCTSMLEKTWSTGISHYEQPHYHPVLDCTYWPVLGYFKKRKIIKLTNKGKSSEDFDGINNIFLYGIIENIYYFVQTGKYGKINTNNTKTMRYYVIKYVSYTFTLK